MLSINPRAYRLLFLLRHSAQGFSAHLLATSPYLVTSLPLPHAIVEKLHVRKLNDVIPTMETAGTVIFSAVVNIFNRILIQDETMDSGRFAPQGAHYHASIIYLLH